MSHAGRLGGSGHPRGEWGRRTGAGPQTPLCRADAPRPPRALFLQKQPERFGGEHVAELIPGGLRATAENSALDATVAEKEIPEFPPQERIGRYVTGHKKELGGEPIVTGNHTPSSLS